MLMVRASLAGARPARVEERTYNQVGHPIGPISLTHNWSHRYTSVSTQRQRAAVEAFMQHKYRFLILFVLAAPLLGQPVGEVVTVGWTTEGKPDFRRSTAQPARDCAPCGKPSMSTISGSPGAKISEELEARLASTSLSGDLRVIVTFPENLAMPPFPALDHGRPYDDAVNVTIRQNRAILASALLNERAARNKIIGGTSGSTPYIGGVTTLLGWWMNSTGLWVYPGYLYTHVILHGNNLTDPTTNNTKGAGLFRTFGLGVSGGWGYVYLNSSQMFETTYPFQGANYDLTAAAWWPEGAVQAHNDIDLYIIDPSGVVRASSVGTSTVFEKTRAAGSITPGTWKVRVVRGSGGTTSAQQVFLAYYYKSPQWAD